MDRKKFEAYLKAAKAIDGDYSTGYQQGLRRHYHGEQFALPTSIEVLQERDDERGEGFRDGYSGKPPRGFHGGLGNANAAGEVELDSWLQVRVNGSAKAGWVKKAQAEGLKLSAWVIKTLNQAGE